MKKLNLNTEFLSEAIMKADGQPTTIHAIADLILPALRTPPTGEGLNFEKAGTIIALLKNIKQGVADKKDYLLIEDAEYAVLVKQLKQMEFKIIDIAICDYLKEVIEAPAEVVVPAA